jgi:hypothetical protein
MEPLAEDNEIAYGITSPPADLAGSRHVAIYAQSPPPRP